MQTKDSSRISAAQLTPLFYHPPYSPDLAPSDFHLSLKLKEFPGGKSFGSDEELENAVTTWLNELAAEEYNMGILKLVNRCGKCLNVGGDEGFCNATWDGLSCWPPVSAGSIASIPCFYEFNGVLYDTLENATRSCEANSSWAERSDYSRCKPLEEEEAHIKVLWDIKEAGTIYYVGYGMSLLALTAALSIFLHFNQKSQGFRPGCWEMATDNSAISKMQIQQLLHCCFNVRRSAILHKNCAIHTSALLQCWNELVAQKRFITCPIDCTGYRTRRTNLLEKERANDKCCRKPTPHSDRLRI
ncbi:Diuretic hormone receptor [Araneus ventricosus]|uniref:Diuretic hormone receptor n=1 Tax=Araneus ventricosus TaxID=182803 RepID=A0A4Y2B5N1_ARAVE|nr:Diuretic hormone receptor [Araneus ventricosus]